MKAMLIFRILALSEELSVSCSCAFSTLQMIFKGFALRHFLWPFCKNNSLDFFEFFFKKYTFLFFLKIDFLEFLKSTYFIFFLKIDFVDESA